MLLLACILWSNRVHHQIGISIRVILISSSSTHLTINREFIPESKAGMMKMQMRRVFMEFLWITCVLKTCWYLWDSYQSFPTPNKTVQNALYSMTSGRYSAARKQRLSTWKISEFLYKSSWDLLIQNASLMCRKIHNSSIWQTQQTEWVGIKLQI